MDEDCIESPQPWTTPDFFLFQKKDANVIEFGSGRGQMSYWMAKASQLEAGQKFILVDKASHRHKYDNKLKDDTSHDITRIRADIQDLVLDQIPHIKESSVSITLYIKYFPIYRGMVISVVKF